MIRDLVGFAIGLTIGGMIVLTSIGLLAAAYHLAVWLLP